MGVVSTVTWVDLDVSGDWCGSHGYIEEGGVVGWLAWLLDAF